MASYLRKLSVNVFNSFRNVTPKLQNFQNVARVIPKHSFSNHNQVNFLNQAVKKSASMDQRKMPKLITRKIENKTYQPGLYNIVAMSTANKYDLESLREDLKIQKLYDITLIDNNKDVLHAVAKYKVETEPREIFFFREGSIVFWNLHKAESNNVLNFLKQFEQDSYEENLVISKTEFMNYAHQDEGADDLCSGKKIPLNQANLLQKLGDVKKMKILINLKSDLLNVPDFYWDHEQFKPLYLSIASYFNLCQHTQAINRRLDICNELIEVLLKNLDKKYSRKLEWIIIILIAMRVLLETGVVAELRL